MQYKDFIPPSQYSTTYYNREEIALCTALRIYLKSTTVFYTLEKFDDLFLNKQRYRCSLEQLDSQNDSIYKSLTWFLTNYLFKYNVEAADIIHYTCKVLNIPPYHIFRNIRDFMHNDISLKRACLQISSTSLIPKTMKSLETCDPGLFQMYSNQFLLFSLIHNAIVVSTSHFIEFSLHLIYTIFSNTLKDPNKKTTAKIHTDVKDVFINLYSIFNKTDKKRWIPSLVRDSYSFYSINNVKISYILMFNYFMRQFDNFYPVLVQANTKIETNSAIPPLPPPPPIIRESTHFHNSGIDGRNYHLRMKKLTDKVDCDYLSKLRFLKPIKSCPVKQFEMPNIEVMEDLQMILFVPSIVIHVATPTRISKKDEMLNKRYAWQICKYTGLTSSGYSQRRDPSGHVYSMNIAGGLSNGRTKLLSLFAAFFNRKYSSVIPNQQIHSDFDYEERCKNRI